MADARRRALGWAAALVALALVGTGIAIVRRSPRPAVIARPPVAGRPGDHAPGLRLPAGPARPGGAIAGRVLDAAGAGLGGAAVTAQRQVDPRERRGPGQPPLVRAAPDGTFRFEDLPAGRYVLAATAAGLMGATSEEIELAPGQAATGITLRLAPGGLALGGRVFDASGGTIPGARIAATAFGKGGRRPAVFVVDSDAGGAYQLRLPAGRYFVNASASGYTQTRAFVELRTDESRDFRLEPAAHIAGRVLSGGEPVAGAEVMAAPEEMGMRSEYGPAISGADGAFRIDELPPGSYRLAARKEALVGTVDRPITVASAGAADGVVITLAAGAVVTGIVRSHDGAAVAGAEVTFTPQQSALIRLAYHHASTDAQGRYRLEGLGPGVYQARAEAAGHASSQGELELSGSTTHDFVLPEGARVSVLVLDSAGRPAAGALVRASTMPSGPANPGFDFAEGLADAQGRYTFRPLQGSRLTVTAAKGTEAGKAGPTELTAGAPQELTVRLERAARVSGTVVWEDGQPAPGVRLQAQGDEMSDLFAVASSGARGEFSLGPFFAGELRVSLTAPGEVAAAADRGPAHGRFTLAAGEQRSGVKLVLSRGAASIAGVVLGPDQQPLAGVVVRAAAGDEEGALLVPDRDGRRRAVTGGDGAFTVEGLPSGTVMVVATHPQYPALLRTGVAAGTRDLRLRLQRGATVDGTVVTGQGAPVTTYRLMASARPSDHPSVAVAAWLTGHHEPLLVEDRAGAFSLGQLPPGAYDLAAMTPDGQVALGAVTLTEGEHKRGLRLVTDDRLTVPGGLEKGGRLRATMISR